MKPSVLLFYRKEELETNQNQSKDNGYIQRGIKVVYRKGGINVIYRLRTGSKRRMCLKYT